MKLVTRRDRLRGLLKGEWWLARGRPGETERWATEASKLNPDTVTPAEYDRVFPGNIDGYCHCSVCGGGHEQVVNLGAGSSMYFGVCGNCLIKALNLNEENC